MPIISFEQSNLEPNYKELVVGAGAGSIGIHWQLISQEITKLGLETEVQNFANQLYKDPNNLEAQNFFKELKHTLSNHEFNTQFIAKLIGGVAQQVSQTDDKGITFTFPSGPEFFALSPLDPLFLMLCLAGVQLQAVHSANAFLVHSQNKYQYIPGLDLNHPIESLKFLALFLPAILNLYTNKQDQQAFEGSSSHSLTTEELQDLTKLSEIEFPKLVNLLLTPKYKELISKLVQTTWGVDVTQALAYPYIKAILNLASSKFFTPLNMGINDAYFQMLSASPLNTINTEIQEVGFENGSVTIKLNNQVLGVNKLELSSANLDLSIDNFVAEYIKTVPDEHKPQVLSYYELFKQVQGTYRAPHLRIPFSSVNYNEYANVQTGLIDLATIQGIKLQIVGATLPRNGTDGYISFTYSNLPPNISDSELDYLNKCAIAKVMELKDDPESEIFKLCWHLGSNVMFPSTPIYSFIKNGIPQIDQDLLSKAIRMRDLQLSLGSLLPVTLPLDWVFNAESMGARSKSIFNES